MNMILATVNVDGLVINLGFDEHAVYADRCQYEEEYVKGDM
jgi:hypothetical protein